MTEEERRQKEAEVIEKLEKNPPVGVFDLMNMGWKDISASDTVKE